MVQQMVVFTQHLKIITNNGAATFGKKQINSIAFWIGVKALKITTKYFIQGLAEANN